MGPCLHRGRERQPRAAAFASFDAVWLAESGAPLAVELGRRRGESDALSGLLFAETRSAFGMPGRPGARPRWG